MTGDPPASGLAERIRLLIRANGPLSVADYMGLCLSDRTHGYYATRDPFGVNGDFVTAPEISQMFGELIGIWFRALWRREGRPSPVRLVELGPGRGTLMADMARAIGQDSGLAEALDIHLVETSPHLRGVQENTLSRAGFTAHWHERFETVPDGCCYVVANEFFDALPIRQFLCTGPHWSERVVGLDAQDELAFGLRPAGRLIEDQGLDLPAPQAGQVLEISPQRQAIAAQIGRRLSNSGGAGLFIDYGHVRSGYGDTFQAVRAHRPDPVLAHPGDADLTSHVDFAALRGAFLAAGLLCPEAMTQADFLLRMGLVERAGQLGRDKDATVQEAIRAAVERLAGPDHMGNLFKVLCATRGKRLAYPFGDTVAGCR